MTVAVMGCVVNGPGESKHANIGISLPGTGERPVAPVYIDGEKGPTLKGDRIAEEFQALVEEYVVPHLRAEGGCMNDLTQKNCVPCEGGVQPLSREQAQSMMKQLGPHWTLADDGKSIRSEWKFRNFYPHDELRQRSRAHRERRGSSPRSRSRLGLLPRAATTPTPIGGLSENDFICAAKIDALPTL